MKLHYERVWDYDIDERKIEDFIIINIKITHYIDLSDIQLRHFSEWIAHKCLNEQLSGVDISKLPNELIKPVTDFIYNRLKKNIESGKRLRQLLAKKYKPS